MDDIAAYIKHYPRFNDGRINYTNQRVCPVVNCTVLCGNEVLLTHRSKAVIAYPDTWNGISGFIDEVNKPLEVIVREELAEEAGITSTDIKTITIRPKLIQIDDNINREWHVFPVLVELAKKPPLKINWENKTTRWVPKSEVVTLKLMPFYAETFQVAIGAGDSD